MKREEIIKQGWKCLTRAEKIKMGGYLQYRNIINRAADFIQKGVDPSVARAIAHEEAIHDKIGLVGMIIGIYVGFKILEKNGYELVKH